MNRNSKHKASNSDTSPHGTNLSVLLKHFVGLQLGVELKCGRIYRGTLREADDYMNLVLSDCDCSKKNYSYGNGIMNANANANGSGSGTQPIDYSLIHVRGPSIRYVHFPDDADLPRLVKYGLERTRAARDKYARGKRTVRSSTT